MYMYASFGPRQQRRCKTIYFMCLYIPILLYYTYYLYMYIICTRKRLYLFIIQKEGRIPVRTRIFNLKTKEKTLASPRILFLSFFFFVFFLFWGVPKYLSEIQYNMHTFTRGALHAGKQEKSART